MEARGCRMCYEFMHILYKVHELEHIHLAHEVHIMHSQN